MFDPLITEKLIQGVVLEFGAVVTSDHQDLCLMLTLSFICKVDDGLLGLTLLLEEIYPSVSSIIIYNHQAVLSTSKTIKRIEAQRDPCEGALTVSLSR